MQLEAAPTAAAPVAAVGVSAAALLRRAVHVVDAQVPAAQWRLLRRALLEVAELQASWDSDAAAAAPPPPPGGRPRLVSFNAADGSHFEPPLWGKDPPLASSSTSPKLHSKENAGGYAGARAAAPSCPRVSELLRLFAVLSSQRAWLAKVAVAPPPPPRRLSIGGATGGAPAGPTSPVDSTPRASPRAQLMVTPACSYAAPSAAAPAPAAEASSSASAAAPGAVALSAEASTLLAAVRAAAP